MLALLTTPPRFDLEDACTGLTALSHFEFHIERIVAEGVYLLDASMRCGNIVEWERLYEYYRVLRKTRGRSHIRKWEIVERHYLHRINIAATQAAYAKAAREARKAGALSAGRTFQWRTLWTHGQLNVV